MPPSSKKLVKPLIVSTLSKNSVWVELIHRTRRVLEQLCMAPMGRYHDNSPPQPKLTLSKMSSDQCDDIHFGQLTSRQNIPCFSPLLWILTYIDIPVVAKKNISRLLKRGNISIPAEEAEFTSGLFGGGRMGPNLTISQKWKENISPDTPDSKEKILITADPTYKALDSVRFIGENGLHSSQSYSRDGSRIHTNQRGPLENP